MSMGVSETNEIVGELYQVPPARFVAARDDLVRKARAAGDRKLARELQDLRRPTQSAWLVNVLTRHDRESMDRLFALGRDLRDAQTTLDGPRLRRLSAERQKIVEELVDRARQRGADAGLRPTEEALSEVRATLQAALVDLAASSKVSAGRLVRPMSYTGFGPMPQVTPPPRVQAGTAEEGAAEEDAAEEVPGAPEATAVEAESGWAFWPVEDELGQRRERAGGALSPVPQPAPAPAAEPVPKQIPQTVRAEAEEAVRRAEADVAAAESAHWQREHDLADAQGALDAARDRLEWLDHQRLEARREKVTAERRIVEARSAQRTSSRAVAETRRALEVAEKRLRAMGEA